MGSDGEVTKRAKLCPQQAKKDTSGEWITIKTVPWPQEVSWPRKKIDPFPMLKILLASGVAASAVALASPAHSAPVYFNPEANVGSNLDTGVGGMDVDLHIGIEGGGAYAQIGPMVKVPDTGEVDYGISGKAGYGFGPGYTELSFVSYDDDTSINLKVGGKFQL
jgi:hypothetical protein